MCGRPRWLWLLLSFVFAGGSGCTTGQGILRASALDGARSLKQTMADLESVGFKCEGAEVPEGKRAAGCQHPDHLNLFVEVKSSPARLVYAAVFKLKPETSCDQVSAKVATVNSKFDVAIASCIEGRLVLQSGIFMPKGGFEPVEVKDFFRWWSVAVMAALSAVKLVDDMA